MSQIDEMSHQEYLGDGVYVMTDGYQAWLSVNSCNNSSVALEPQVLVALMKWTSRVMPQVSNAMVASVKQDD